jgi:hypothetical protein
MTVNFRRALKGGDGFTLISVYVSTGAKNPGISGYNEWRDAIELKIRSPARGGRANREIIEEMGRLFGQRVEIVRGERSNLKTLKVYAEFESVFEKLAGLIK